MEMVLVWFRRDLRLCDNPALAQAAADGARVIPVYVHAPDEAGDWTPGAASDWWLHHSLQALEASLRKAGSRLIIRRGPAADALLSLAEQTGARAVYWNRCYEPALVDSDKTVKTRLTGAGLECRNFNGSLLYEPWSLRTGSGGPYRVFTAYWKACQRLPAPREPWPGPARLSRPPRLESVSIDELHLLPEIPWDEGLAESWRAGEGAAADRLWTFCEERLADYPELRDRPDMDGASLLSAHLHFGEISPHQVVHGVNEFVASNRGEGLRRGAESFIRQIGWREFAHHVLYHFPETPEKPLDGRFRRFPWAARTGEALKAWRQARTGFPIVDAGMRQLWRTGVMHNRVRMIAASFLVKNLRVPWQQGERWFWDTLVDADLANNTLGWQWAAGCGADAAPYFRIFSPVRQGERFDPEGIYVRRWVPELAALPHRFIHRPWEARQVVLEEAGIVLGRDYPRPVVDLDTSRREALAAFESLKRSG
jgi:deoxyribodipyrimidine photo-lyase